MGKYRNGSVPEEGDRKEEERKGRKRKSKSRKEDSGEDDDDSSVSEDERIRNKKRKKNKNGRDSRRSSRRRGRRSGSESNGVDSHSASSASYSDSSDSRGDSESGSSDSVSEKSEEEMRRRKKESRRRRKEREYEKERRRRRKEKERRREKEEKRKKRKEKKKKKKENGTAKKGAVTNSWGKYGIIKETDMWNKRPEFTAWLAEVKQVNLETLPNWEEKQMFKEFMEDHNTATFPSKKYYDLDTHHRRMMAKEIKKGMKNVAKTERTIFNDEEQRRQELLRIREKQKEEQVEVLKRSMQSGMAQAMKEQAQLREEMAYQYRVGNSENIYRKWVRTYVVASDPQGKGGGSHAEKVNEGGGHKGRYGFPAAAAIQRRLDPDVAM